jgi:hypothetical protein
MEQAYWLSRERTSQVNAWSTACVVAKLVHLELAGRYSIKAAEAARDHQIAFELDAPRLQRPAVRAADRR